MPWLKKKGPYTCYPLGDQVKCPMLTLAYASPSCAEK
jgi:hypothetical protein